MKINKKIFTILIMFFMIGTITGCGSDNDEKENSRSDEVVEEPTKEPSTNDGQLVPSISQVSDGQIEYKVKNQSEKDVTLDFTSSQRYDYVIKTKEGEIVYQHSSVSSFLQVLGTETIKPGEELSYNIVLPPNEFEMAEYLLEVWLTPKNGEVSKVSLVIDIH